MKRVIAGKIYDTAESELLHWWDNDRDDSDWKALDEDLYRAKDGSYFVVGSGGPATRYRRRAGGNGWTGGSGIRVLTEDEAMAWLEAHDGTEALLVHFGERLGRAGGGGTPTSKALETEGMRLAHDYRLDYMGRIGRGDYQVPGWCRVRIFEPLSGKPGFRPVAVVCWPDVPGGYDGPSVSDNASIIVAKILSTHALPIDEIVLIEHSPGGPEGLPEGFELLTFPGAGEGDGPDELGEPSHMSIDRPEVEALLGIRKIL